MIMIYIYLWLVHLLLNFIIIIYYYLLLIYNIISIINYYVGNISSECSTPEFLNGIKN